MNIIYVKLFSSHGVTWKVDMRVRSCHIFPKRRMWQLDVHGWVAGNHVWSHTWQTAKHCAWHTTNTPDFKEKGFFSPSSEQALLEYVSALRKQGKVERVEALTVALLQLWQLKFGNLLYVLETYTLQMSVSAALYSLLRAQVWTIRDSSLWK